METIKYCLRNNNTCVMELIIIYANNGETPKLNTPFTFFGISPLLAYSPCVWTMYCRYRKRSKSSTTRTSISSWFLIIKNEANNDNPESTDTSSTDRDDTSRTY